MLVKDACELGLACGLNTIKEACLNVEFHCTSIFSYEDLDKELTQLEEDLYNYNPEEEILKVFPDMEEKDE